MKTKRDRAIVEMYKAGMTPLEIATDLSVSRQRIYQILARNQICMGNRGPRRKTEELDERVYKFLVDYKRDHDGNTPGLRLMIDSTRAGTYSVLLASLDRLADANRIRFGIVEPSHIRKATYIEVVGGVWLAPNTTDE